MLRKAALVLIIAMLQGVLLQARAQDAPSSPQPADSAAPTDAPTQSAQWEVQIDLEKFGTGNQCRVGDWTGIRVRIQDTASKPRELILRLESFDADGDHPWYQRLVAANQGTWQPVWLYCRLPFDYAGRSGKSLVVSAYTAVETPGQGEDGAAGYRTGRLVGRLALQPQGTSVVPAAFGLFGVLGQKNLGLSNYAIRAAPSDLWQEFGTEVIERVSGITPADLPDRWMGLAQFDAIIWTEGDPATLKGERAKALREWILRGGHLLVVLPPVGQTWTNPGSNELYDLMPAVLVTPHQQAAMEPYRSLLTTSDSSLFPKVGTVQTFAPRPESLPSEAVRILSGPDNDCVVVRRLAGAGAVTLIGLDLNQTALSQFEMIDTEVFWHRVLGKRGQLVNYLKGQKPGALAPPGSKKDLPLDSNISADIAKAGYATAGVLVGLVVFALYWAVAGPLGFAVLRKKGWSQHSWLFFVASSIVFTALAWGGATALRPKRVDVTHFTILDHVFGQTVQRARAWASVLVPWYGSASIGIGEGPSGARQTMSAVAPWDSADGSGGGADFGGFPDSRGYPVDAKIPDHLSVPSRSTVKQVQLDWAGPPRWQMPMPVADASGGPGKIVLHENWLVQQLPMLSGTLRHNLPAPLENVFVIVVTGQNVLAPPRPRTDNVNTSPIWDARIFTLGSAPWPPGDPLYLDTITKLSGDGSSKNSILSAYLSDKLPRTVSSIELNPQTAISSAVRLLSLALFSQLTPPDRDASLTSFVPQRRSTHGWDLSWWFTQPCVILLGELPESCDSPIPITVDGEIVRAHGRTMVRWVYPLPDSPPRFPPAPKSGASGG